MKIAILCMISACIGALIFDAFLSKKYEKKCKWWQDQYNKQYQYLTLTNIWLFMRQKKYTIEGWLLSRGYKKVIIYGMQELGSRLYDELIGTEIEIVCVMDKNKNKVLGDYNLIDLTEPIPEADVIIVTPLLSFPSIEKDLQKRVTCPIFPIEYLVHDMHNQ